MLFVAPSTSLDTMEETDFVAKVLSFVNSAAASRNRSSNRSSSVSLMIPFSSVSFTFVSSLHAPIVRTIRRDDAYVRVLVWLVARTLQHNDGLRVGTRSVWISMEISISHLGGDLRIFEDVDHVKDPYHRSLVPPAMHPHLWSSRSAGKKRPRRRKSAQHTQQEDRAQNRGGWNRMK